MIRISRFTFCLVCVQFVSVPISRNSQEAWKYCYHMQFQNQLLQALCSIKYFSFQSKLLTDYESHTFLYYLFIKLEQNCTQFAQNCLNCIYFKFKTYFNLHFICNSSSLVQVKAWHQINSGTSGDQVQRIPTPVDLIMCTLWTFIGSHIHILTSDSDIYLLLILTHIQRHCWCCCLVCDTLQ